MTNHVRIQIRNKIEAILKFPGVKTFNSRIDEMEPNDYPAICIYATEERAENDTTMALGRQLSLSVECFERGEDIENKIDQMCGDVEDAIYANPSLDGLILYLDLFDTGITYQSEGSLRTGVAVLNFNIFYRTKRGQSEVSI